MKKLLESVGVVISQPERMLNAVTAVSGAGPAYVFYLAEAMIKASRELGFKSSVADMLVMQTILGAGRMLKNSSDTPEVLRRKVTSPGGVTEQAVKHFDRNKLQSILIKAIERANKRASELEK